MSNTTLNVQCKNIFKNSDNIQKSFNRLWADIISDSEQSKSGLENAGSLIYNKDVQSYPRLERKGVE